MKRTSALINPSNFRLIQQSKSLNFQSHALPDVDEDSEFVEQTSNGSQKTLGAVKRPLGQTFEDALNATQSDDQEEQLDALLAQFQLDQLGFGE